MPRGVRDLVKKAHHERADVIIGKKGVTEAVLLEIKARLEKKRVIKVKVLKKALEKEGMDRRELAKRVAEAVNAKLMGVRGRTFILYKPQS